MSNTPIIDADALVARLLDVEPAPLNLRTIPACSWAEMMMQEEFGFDPGGSVYQDVKSKAWAKIELLRSRGMDPAEIDAEVREFVSSRRPEPSEDPVFVRQIPDVPRAGFGLKG